ncbi:hypothetical protein MNBD_GAMMA14-726 [hydrothermal vent metagenome]|uniref:Uncharacterized protein n=1 Tax=hydrothermal vent metagenome TaxID=652676 RepID=A0A3B0Z4G9_9ZZZZ
MNARYVIALALLAGSLVTAAVFLYSPASTPPDDNTSIASFIEKHWQHPIAAQGAAPPDYSTREASLDASACGVCHSAQYQDWSNSLHSRSVGAGLQWQLQVLPPVQALKCLNCHAPLAEQKTLLAQKLDWPGVNRQPPPAYVPQDLHRQGVSCPVCHLRRQQRFGPPPGPGIPPGDTPGLPHGGYSAQQAFTDSRFCSTCHQFPEDGPAINGKLLENTYAEWRDSPYPARGKSCQSCHMPQRKHLWRGIHDPAMVRQALSVDLDTTLVNDHEVAVQAQVRNSGAGHFFPTYLVARVEVSLWLLDPQGKRQTQLASAIISRDLDIWLTEEYSDTRLAPNETLTLKAQLDRPRQPGWQIELRIDVAPREHYERMFESVLRDQGDKLSMTVREELETALGEARNSHYNALKTRRPLPAVAIAN